MASLLSLVAKVNDTIFDKLNNSYQYFLRESIFNCNSFHFMTHTLTEFVSNNLIKNLVASDFLVINKNAMIVF